MKDEVVVIDPDGSVRYIYSDTLASLFEDEEQETRRASHVEPASTFGWDHCDGWLADMRPSGGPLLFDGYERERPGVKRAFRTRQAALDAELAWLRQNRGL